MRCLDSVFRIDGPTFVVVVCDNASSDQSLDRIEDWADGGQPTPGSGSSTYPSVHKPEKPIPVERLSRADAERGASAGARLVLIQNGANLGFAGGCNVGVRFALAHASCAFVWLLNNDTVVDKAALTELVDLCIRDPSVGICGSQVRFFDDRQTVQSFGGRLDRWFCSTHHLFCGAKAAEVLETPADLDYVPGVSMLVTRAFLERVGLMAEEYFLYFEEIDWAERARPHFRPAVTMRSVVYHIGGASIGSPSEQGARGLRSDYFLLRGRLLFAGSSIEADCRSYTPG